MIRGTFLTCGIIFQPAEEKGGVLAMCKEGIMDKFEIDQVYGIHTHLMLNLDDLKLIQTLVFAVADDFTINIGRRWWPWSVSRAQLTQ